MYHKAREGKGREREGERGNERGGEYASEID